MVKRLLCNEKGFAIIFSMIISMFSILILAVIGIMGYAKIVEHVAYDAADASALAGASQFSYISTDTDPWKWGASTTYIAMIDPVLAQKKAAELFADNSKLLDYLVKDVQPTYQKINDYQYQVSVTVKYKPFYTTSIITKTIVATAGVKHYKST
jgi:hypothetical protein